MFSSIFTRNIQTALKSIDTQIRSNAQIYDSDAHARFRIWFTANMTTESVFVYVQYK